jgi:hypothetical protein
VLEKRLERVLESSSLRRRRQRLLRRRGQPT